MRGKGFSLWRTRFGRCWSQGQGNEVARLCVGVSPGRGEEECREPQPLSQPASGCPIPSAFSALCTTL